MKLGLVVGEFTLARGGAERVGVELATHLAHHAEVHVFTSYIRPEDRMPSIQFHLIPMAFKGGMAAELNFAVAAARVVREARMDVVHSHNMVLLDNDIFTTHCLHAGRFYKALREREGGAVKNLLRRVYPKHRVYLALEHWKLRRHYRGLVALSRGQAQEIHEHYGIPLDEIHVVPNGMNLERFGQDRRQPRAEIRQSLQIRDDELVGLFVGNYFRQKGLDVALKALVHARGHLLVLGKDDPAPFQRLAVELGVADRVHWMGYVVEPSRYFFAADYFVFPSVYETSPLVGIEAAAAGLPIVTSNVNGLADFVVDASAGYVVDREPRAVAQRIQELQDQELRRIMGERARNASKQFSWDAATKKLLSVYLSAQR